MADDPGLWAWALRAYDQPSVREGCLALQDEHGQCVCLLLWAGWLAQGRVAPSPGSLSEAVRLARAWEDDVLRPLRAARRGLKRAPGLGEAERAALRARVQAEELAAERAFLDILAALPAEAATASGWAAAALTAACEAWGEPAPRDALIALAGAFPPV